MNQKDYIKRNNLTIKTAKELEEIINQKTKIYEFLTKKKRKQNKR